jgi:hypothetical protein
MKACHLGALFRLKHKRSATSCFCFYVIIDAFSFAIGGSMPESAKLLVFLSYANEDKAKVKSLCKRLKTDGFDPWLDDERVMPGMDRDLEIKQAMHASQAILLCFSRLSVASDGYVHREYKKAMDYQQEKPEGTIFVIPLRLDDCEIPFSIRELQYVDYPYGYLRLAAALNKRAEQVRARKGVLKQEKDVPTRPIPRRQKTEKVQGGPVYNIGAIHVNRDFIQGDQTNQTYVTSTSQIQSPVEFVSVLEQVRAQLATLRQGQRSPALTRNLEVVESHVQVALAEAQKPRPLGERVRATLSEAKEMLDLLGGSLTAAAALGSTLGGLVLLAVKVFGK